MSLFIVGLNLVLYINELAKIRITIHKE